MWVWRSRPVIERRGVESVRMEPPLQRLPLDGVPLAGEQGDAVRWEVEWGGWRGCGF